GPRGEMTELLLSNMLLDIDGDQPGSSSGRVNALEMAFDVTVGMTFKFSPCGTNLMAEVTKPDPAEIHMSIVYSPLAANLAALQAIFAPQIAEKIAGLSLSFELPPFKVGNAAMRIRGVE